MRARHLLPFCLLAATSIASHAGATAAVVEPGDLLVCDQFNKAVYVVDSSNGERYLVSAGSDSPHGVVGGGTGELTSPDGIAVGSDGFIYVADGLSGDVIQIDPANGNRTRVYDGTGVLTGLAIGPSGEILVCDIFKDEITALDPTSAFSPSVYSSAAATVGRGTGDAFVSADGIAVHGGIVYVVEGLSGAIIKVTADGNRTELSPGTGAATGIAIDPNGTDLLVNQIFSDKLMRVAMADGTPAEVVSAPPPALAFANGDGLTVSSDGASAFVVEGLAASLTEVTLADGSRSTLTGSGTAFLVPTKATTVPVPTSPEIDVTGGGMSIAGDGSNVPLSGDGTDFGSSQVGNSTAETTFVIANTGTAPLGITLPVVLGGANPGDFAISTSPSATVAPAGMVNLGITFTPTATGTRTATVTITNDDADEGSYVFNIQGTGTPASSDTVPPVITAPFKVVESAPNPGDMSAVVSWTAATAVDDIDGSVPVTCTNNPGDTFPVGTTTVTCTATDAAGNSATHTIMVIVKANAADAFHVANTGDTPTGSPGPLTGLKGAFLAGDSKILVEGSIGASPSKAGLFTGPKSGPLTQVALAGTSPAGTTGDIAGFDRWFINSTGSVAYRARLAGTGITTANDRGLWLDGAAVAVEGGTDPDTGGTFFEFPGQGQALTESDYYYHARLVIGPGGITKDDNSGIYSAGGGLLLQQGDPAPGAGAGVRHTRFSNQLGANDDGDVVFSSNLGGTGISGGINNIGLFSGPPATASLVAQRGDVVPGLTGSPEIDRISDEAINAGGETAFSVILKNGTVTTADNSALLTSVGGSLQAVAREGDTALGFGGATEVYDEFDDVFICADGAVYFKAVVRGGAPPLTANEDEAIYVWRDGAGLCLIAKEGSGAPGLVTTDVIALPALTAHPAGNAAFSALLRRGVGGVTRSNNEGVWSVPMGACTADLVLRGGDSIDVGGTTETVKRPSIAETPDDGTGGRSSSAGGGNISITATYQNGRQTGVFVIGQP